MTISEVLHNELNTLRAENAALAGTKPYHRPDPRVSELEAQIAVLLVAIEAKDAALNLWKVASGNAEESELDGMACYCITMPLFCDAYDATEALALSPSTELLEARDRVRDAKLLRAVDRYLLDIGDSCSDDPLNELAKARESGGWQLGLGD